MGKFCEVCHKGVVSGNSVSHSNHKTRRTWAPNTQRVRVNVNGTPIIRLSAKLQAISPKSTFP